MLDITTVVIALQIVHWSRQAATVIATVTVIGSQRVGSVTVLVSY